MLGILVVLMGVSVSAEVSSFLASSSELNIEGDPGVSFITGQERCRLGYVNTTQPLTLTCHDTSDVLYFDQDSQTHFGTSTLTKAEMKFTNGLTVGNVHQWSLIHIENFEAPQADGWSNNTVTDCGGVSMLGGHCQFSAGETKKEYVGIPTHTYLRLKANFHCIDEWHGETGYVSIGSNNLMNKVWSTKYDINNAIKPINICGDNDKGEAQFSNLIDVMISHESSSIIIAFGSTLEEQPCEKSWGISGLQIYIR